MCVFFKKETPPTTAAKAPKILPSWAEYKHYVHTAMVGLEEDILNLITTGQE